MADSKQYADPNTHKRHQVSIMGSPSGKRSKREWLAYHGAKHTRVGEGFQVTILPTLAKKDEKGKDIEEKDSKNEKGE